MKTVITLTPEEVQEIVINHVNDVLGFVVNPQSVQHKDNDDWEITIDELNAVSQ